VIKHRRYVGMDIEQLETENNELRDKLLEIKELIDNLSYLWDAGSFYPDGERVVNELREIADSIED
tara:strand:+ start:266 stop:463 length:198 start_codon:yes stop_codon:yes gene_type:complete